MDKIRVGIIGFGYWGPNLARNFFELTASELVVIADLKQDRLKRVTTNYPNVIVTQDYQEFFNLGLDAVVVSTPPAVHFPVAKDCLQHNLPVLIEKPMTLNSKHAEELIELAEEKDLTLMVGHTFEYNSTLHQVKEIMKTGELGHIYYIDIARLNLGLFQRDSNVLWDLAPHDISILLFLLEKDPISVSTYGMNCVFEDNFDVAYMNLMFPDCIPALVHVSWLDPCKVRRVTVVGSKKMLVFNDVEIQEKIKIYDKGVDKPEYTNGYNQFQCSYRYGDIHIPKINVTEPLRQECQHFIDCIINHTEPRTSGRDGLRVIKILEAAQRSMTNGSTRELIQL